MSHEEAMQYQSDLLIASQKLDELARLRMKFEVADRKYNELEKRLL